MVVCSNPKCQKEIEEPILLTILSVTPPKKYKACPYCFANLEPEPYIEQEDVPESIVEQEGTIIEEDEEVASNLSVDSVSENVKDSGPRFLKKVKALFSNSKGSQKEKRKKPEERQSESSGKEETAMKVEPQPKPSTEKEKGSSGCPQTLGYLANRPKDTPVPQECLVCPKMVDCMLSPRINKMS